MSMHAYRWARSWRGELSAAQFAVLLALADRFNDEKGCAWPSYATIADDTRLSRRTAMRAVRTLVEIGLVEVRQGSGMGRLPSNRYALPLYSEPSAPVDNSTAAGGEVVPLRHQ